MRWSQLPVQTLREEPAEGDRRLRLLVRAGYLSFSGPLYLGERTLRKIEEAITGGGLEASGLRFSVDEIEGDLAPEEFHTPGVKTIAELSALTGLPETSLIKSVVMHDGTGLVLALVRGDHTLDEKALGAVRPASPEEIQAVFHADPGSLGPVGLAGVRILADEALRGRQNMICGANHTDYHLRHVTPGEDFQAEYLRLRKEGDGPGATGVPVRAEGGGLVGSVGAISAERVLMELALQGRDDAGLVLPPRVAPFSVVITPVNIADAAQRAAAESLYEAAQAAGCEVLLDDRDLRPGVKFKDAELIGFPWRVTLGRRLSDGLVEVQERRGRTSWEVPVSEAVGFVRGRWDAWYAA